jgi:hypothetical protein
VSWLAKRRRCALQKGHLPIHRAEIFAPPGDALSPFRNVAVSFFYLSVCSICSRASRIS